MPKVTFYNLNEEKKQILMTAIKKEFSRVPLFEASIANIVKSASIPRGSFYQYFEDKEDAFFHLLNDYAKQQKIQFISTLKKHDGDLFKTMLEFFQLLIKEESHIKFLRNTLLNMTYKIENTFTRIFSDHSFSESYKEIYALINKAKLNISNEIELFHTIQIVTTITFRNLMEKFAKNLSTQQALSNFEIEMKLLKNGLARQG